MPVSLGLIAGSGVLPSLVARDARGKGYRVVAAAIESLTDPSISEHAGLAAWFNAGKVGSIIRFFRENGVEEAVMAGKIPKGLLYTGKVRPDLKAIGMLMRLRDRKDDSIILAVEREFKKEGIRFLDMKDFLSGFLTPAGRLTRKRPDKRELKDIEFGFSMAKEIGALDIGQTVVVKERAVMAVEAIEGTDEAIRRGGRLAGGGAVVVKVSRPAQDMRFDVPVVGLDTLDAMIEAGVGALALEAGKSLFVDREEFIKRADRAGISVMGVKSPG
jgi:DUF1009 family protein